MSDDNRAGDVNITGGAGGIHGDGAPVNIDGGVGGVTIKGGDGGTPSTEYPGGVTWVDKEYDPYFMELPPDERFRKLKAVGRWLKEHVLAAVVSAVIIAFLTTILVFYTNQWLGQHQAVPQPATEQPKAMPV